MKIIISVLLCVIAYSGYTQGIVSVFENEWRWVSANIQYVPDRVVQGVTQHWASPQQTMKIGKGDCEDFAVLLQHRLKTKGIQSKVVIVKNKDGRYHALLKVWYWYIEPQIFGKYLEKKDLVIDEVLDIRNIQAKVEKDNGATKNR